MLPQAQDWGFNMEPCAPCEENRPATLQQTKKNNAKTKQKRSINLSCVNRKTKPSHKESDN
jgi:hypothetical protein